MKIISFIYLHRRNNETVIPNKSVVENCRRPGRADDNGRYNNFIFSSLLSNCLKWILLYETIFLWNNNLSCLRRMICCSCHTPTITYIMKKAQMTSRKGPTTPLEGVWWGLWGLSIAWSPMLLILSDGCIIMSPPKKAEFKDETARRRIQRWNCTTQRTSLQRNKTAAHTHHYYFQQRIHVQLLNIHNQFQ